MSKTKKLLSIILCFSIIFAFGACSKNQNENNDNTKKLSIICTIFPEYDWVKNILGDRVNDVDLTLLLDNGIDLHNYQPTVDDLVKISNCDMFVYVGGESDKWVADALANAENKDMIVVNLLEALGDSTKEEEVKEGMEIEEEEHSEGDEEAEYDEHVWLSLQNATVLCNALSEKIQSIDSENASIYDANTESYVKSLADLDNQYKDVCDKVNTKTLVFGDRFPFRYLVDDYGLDYYAAFVGCSAETEASFETISFLADKVDELNLNTILTIEGSDRKIAETIISNTVSKNQEILSLNSMQGITSENVKNGVTYLSIMTDNLSVLEKALA
ncbi:MAG: metal ABC transporter substrate-binding protein [Eubacterium sp.]